MIKFNLQNAITNKLLHRPDVNDFGFIKLKRLIYEQLCYLLEENYFEAHTLSVLSVDRGDTINDCKHDCSSTTNEITISIADYSDLSDYDASRLYHGKTTKEEMEALTRDGIDLEPKFRNFKITIEEIIWKRKTL